jgi:glycerol-3-phosphate dehydrogenase
LCALCPPLNQANLLGGFRYFDAQVDDARLVFRLIREAVQAGGTALNYTRVEELCHSHSGRVTGVTLRDQTPGANRWLDISAEMVINATGAWADNLRMQAGPGVKPRLRRLRGSHLVFSFEKLPLTRAVCIQHPQDNRPVFAFPWEGVTLVGTTDVDHSPEMQTDPSISQAEAEYLLAWTERAFPSLGLGLPDVQATFSGVRAVVNTGKADPSKESREHILWQENGLLSVSGGKLTTFRIMAHAALGCIASQLSGKPRFRERQRLLEAPPEFSSPTLPPDPAVRLRLCGRYGQDAILLASTAEPGDWERIAGSSATWAELRWAARAEAVVHLDDLLLRRVRLGLVLPEGGLPWMESLRTAVQPELGWDDARWEQEVCDYAKLWRSSYSVSDENR